MPYIWNYEYAVGAIVLICLYTSLYATYWNLIDESKRARWIFAPYLLYLPIAIILSLSINNWVTSLWLGVFLPIYGLICFLCVKQLRKYSKRLRKRIRYGKVITYTIVIVFFLALKTLSVLWVCQEHKSLDSEKIDIIER